MLQKLRFAFGLFSLYPSNPSLLLGAGLILRLVGLQTRVR
jgi:hypothetical protein